MKPHGCTNGCKTTAGRVRIVSVPPRFSASLRGFPDWLGCRDSNPNYLIQSQASYR
ncbi:MAG: hypothetical protein QOJ59_256 [Thermomicrobiales bacterium]|nr:hypothetical protein [Thermomicrobiales bacterium]